MQVCGVRRLQGNLGHRKESCVWGWTVREEIGKTREVGLDLADSSGNAGSPTGQQEVGVVVP